MVKHILMRIYLFSAIFSIVSSALFSQDFQAKWTGHFSYSNVQDLFLNGNDIYAAAENAVFHYNTASKKTKTYTSIEGLSGETITMLHYNIEKNLIIIGYQTGLINIIIKEGEKTRVLKVVDIQEKLSLSPDKKIINHFLEHENKLFISTDYGISVFDLNRLEFGDTYFIGDGGSQISVRQTAILNSELFAATDKGIRKANINDNSIIDYNSWSTISSGNFRAIGKIKNELYTATTSNAVLHLEPNGTLTQKRSFPQGIQKFRIHNDLLTISTSNSAHVFSEGFINRENIDFIQNYDLKLNSALASGNHVFLGTEEDGLLIVPFGSAAANQILPNGPVRNKPFALDSSKGQLWVVFGETTVHYNPYPYSKYGISRLQDSVWTNTSFSELQESLQGKEVTDLVKVTINPNKPTQAYMSSFHKGLMKVEDGNPVILYDETNSPLENIRLGSSNAGIRLFGSAFDREGNLWFVQSRAEKGLIRLSPEGQFRKIDLSNIIDAPSELALTKLVITREGYVFFGSYHNGLLGYNPTNNKLFKIGQNPGSGNLPSAVVRALAVDAQNRIWIGTLQGLRLLHSPGSFFEGGIRDSQPIIIMEDGVAQELLYQQPITAIEVDGSNNKWIATATSGVFYVSSNGQETLLRFTKDNSPLPSNNVQDISIDHETGVVYFATTQGLVSYKGNATAPRSTLDKLRAFPNPVRPEYSGMVTIDGLTSQANVKITDVAGNLVYETTSQGGSIQWDTTAFGKYKVRSGVYFIMVTTEDDKETKVAKVMIVR